MKKTCFVIALALCGLALLAPSPASAQDCFGCDCNSSCSQICYTGPDIPDCPECNQSTCGQSGVCVGDPSCPGGGSSCPTNWTNTIYGTSSGDTLNGAATNDRIFGYDGADTIDGNAGDDTVYAGNGTDTVYGDSGNDCLYGEGGNDHLRGQSGSNDFTDGGAGTDNCIAESEANCEI